MDVEKISNLIKTKRKRLNPRGTSSKNKRYRKSYFKMRNW